MVGVNVPVYVVVVIVNLFSQSSSSSHVTYIVVVVVISPGIELLPTLEVVPDGGS